MKSQFTCAGIVITHIHTHEHHVHSNWYFPFSFSTRPWFQQLLFSSPFWLFLSRAVAVPFFLYLFACVLSNSYSHDLSEFFFLSVTFSSSQIEIDMFWLKYKSSWETNLFHFVAFDSKYLVKFLVFALCDVWNMARCVWVGDVLLFMSLVIWLKSEF